MWRIPRNARAPVIRRIVFAKTWPRFKMYRVSHVQSGARLAGTKIYVTCATRGWNCTRRNRVGAFLVRGKSKFHADEIAQTVCNRWSNTGLSRRRRTKPIINDHAISSRRRVFNFHAASRSSTASRPFLSSFFIEELIQYRKWAVDWDVGRIRYRGIQIVWRNSNIEEFKYTNVQSFKCLTA